MSSTTLPGCLSFILGEKPYDRLPVGGDPVVVDLALVDRPNDRLVEHVDDVERRVVFGGDGGGRDDRVGRRLAPIDGDEHEVDSERAAGHIRLSDAGK